MKIVELTNSIHVPINNEEADLLGKFDSKDHVARRELNEREVMVANQLVNKDVLLRKRTDGKTTYIKKIKN
jgi:hypothetical protein